MALVRIFTAFDYDNDADLRMLLVGQAKNPDTPFEIADWSVQEPFTGNWKEKVRSRIRSVNQVCVLCGKYTNRAAGVAAELQIAQEEGKPYFLLWGRANDTCVKPSTAKSTDQIYKWTWENLKSLIHGSR